MTPDKNYTAGSTGKNVLYISLMLTLLFVIWGAALPDNLDLAAGNALNFLTTNFGWFYLSAVFFVLLFIIGIAFSPYGKIKLGRDDEKPEFSTPAWFAMLFTTGMGIGLVFWSIAEPITHFMSPPLGKQKLLKQLNWPCAILSSTGDSTPGLFSPLSAWPLLISNSVKACRL